MKRHVFALVILTAVFAEADGQQIFGSPYSYYGIGDIGYRGAGINNARGTTGIGSRPWYDVNLMNPAAYTSPVVPSNSVFLADYAFSFMDFSYDREHFVSSQNSLTNLAMWFKPRNDLGIVFGMTPYSKMGYSINEVKSLEGYGNYNVLHKGAGGINRYYAGLGYTLWKKLSIGANVNYLFGSLQRETRVDLEELSATYSNERTSLGSFAFDFGVQYSQKFGRNSYLTVGATMAKGTTMATVQTNQLVNAEDATVLIAWDSFPDDYVTPDEYGVGLELSFNDRLSVGGDFVYRGYSAAHLGKGLSWMDTRRLSGGVDWMPNPAGQGYLGRMVLRAGGFYETQPWNIATSQLAGYGLTSGVSFPVSNYFSRLNIGFEWKRRGSASEGLESVYGIHVGVTLHDRWFQKRAYD